MHICTECGRVSEEDYDFCPHCGSTKGANVDPALIPPQFKVVSSNQGTFIVKQSAIRIKLALALALIPGIFNIFGLGHFALGKYVRGVLFLACSGFYYYERYIGYFGIGYWYLFGFSMAVFLVQILDVFNLIKKELGILG